MIATTLDLTALIADVRAERLDDTDLHDIAASVDAGESEYIGRGRDTWQLMALRSVLLDVSAEDLVEEIVAALG